MSAVAALLGFGFVAGLMLMVAGLRGRLPHEPAGHQSLHLGDAVGVGLVACLVGVVVAAVTGWPVAGLAAVVGVVALRRAFRADTRPPQLQMVDALATWPEMLRDSLLAGGHGLQTVIRATAPAAPLALRSDVVQLAEDCRVMSFHQALDAFAGRVAHPLCDKIVLGLKVQGGEGVAAVLTSIATTARREADLYRRIDAGRSTEVLAAKCIVGITLGVTALLMLGSRAFLAFYDTVLGQAALAVVIAVITAGVWWVMRAARRDPPPRVLIGGPTR